MKLFCIINFVLLHSEQHDGFLLLQIVYKLETTERMFSACNCATEDETSTDVFYCVPFSTD